MAYLTLFDDKTHYISQGGSLIAYTLQGRVAVILGDPVGPARDVRSAVTEFQKYCAQNDWLPAFCLTAPNYLEQYRRAGFDYICLGHEAIIDLADFNLNGRISSSYRKRYNRMAKKGYRLVFHEPPLSDELLTTLRAISDEWLRREAGAEKRFFWEF
jgi:phosphatidylglycerol lysyltransferase